MWGQVCRCEQRAQHGGGLFQASRADGPCLTSPCPRVHPVFVTDFLYHVDHPVLGEQKSLQVPEARFRPRGSQNCGHRRRGAQRGCPLKFWVLRTWPWGSASVCKPELFSRPAQPSGLLQVHPLPEGTETFSLHPTTY